MSKFSKGHHKAAKLTPELVIRIYERAANGDSQGSIARDMEVSVGQVGRIVRGEVWQQLHKRWANGLPITPSETNMHFALQRLSVGQPELDEQSPEILASLERTMRLLNDDMAEELQLGPSEILKREEPTGQGLAKLMKTAQSLELDTASASEFRCTHPGCEEQFPTGVLLAEHSLEHLK